ncbi:MAG TPA: hypothetical protein IAC57_04920 [Candidatus Scatosoma pullistercoris]|uniref:Uncharacterized protein n=1 Tax=Candidatus Scatosoma pullistercoris TaxID=2840934 RepID=A0A9D1MF95_9FIRM|nr:hypothetical protein [Candidatus Scatosoma pullistercoris]
MMKDDEKFADEVFEKISAYERKKKKRRRVLAGVLSGGFACTCVCVLIALFAATLLPGGKNDATEAPGGAPGDNLDGEIDENPEEEESGSFWEIVPDSEWDFKSDSGF